MDGPPKIPARGERARLMWRVGASAAGLTGGQAVWVAAGEITGTVGAEVDGYVTLWLDGGGWVQIATRHITSASTVGDAPGGGVLGRR